MRPRSNLTMLSEAVTSQWMMMTHDSARKGEVDLVEVGLALDTYILYSTIPALPNFMSGDDSGSKTKDPGPHSRG